MNWLAIAAGAIGMSSAAFYLARRRWTDAALVLAAGAALAGAVGAFDGVDLPGAAGTTLDVSTQAPPTALDGVRTLRLDGDGLRGAQWDDLPARPLAWTAPATPSIRLDFPRTLALGRMFALRLERSWRAPGRLQLLAENGQVLAEAKGEGALAVQWLPPLAESLVLRARLFDAAGKVVDEGPVPFVVEEPLPLRVRGRFGAPSFDLRVLDDLLAASAALIDWQVALGRQLRRAETAREEIAQPDLEIVDAAWFERAGEPARKALLERVAQGAALLVLGANAGDAGPWSRSLGLHLAPQPAGKTVGTVLPMSSGALAPNDRDAGAWRGADGLWTRDWQRGRIGWLGVGDWHRHAIAQPRQLALWWQGMLDRLRVRRERDVAWLDPQDMPLPRERLAVCARGVRLPGQVAFPGLAQMPALAWQRRPGDVDAACVAVWPETAGWLRMRASAGAAAREVEGRVYVYAPGDWPLWQRSGRRDASARYAARTPAPAAPLRRALPAWPFGLAFVLAMLALWWRERR
ncbi:hypothetical protein [uncultured Massilia sp.]|uniref:hypothetical protein n=1 Tax=uncultured Massilia sp. TaxID=169973 RepID=UPI0025CD1D7A|nr:hypothetical protein [uncultured Massilia sp.]